MKLQQNSINVARFDYNYNLHDDAVKSSNTLVA